MSTPLRLGISGSAFIYAMPREILERAYWPPITRFDDRLNDMMAEFMRDMMRSVSGTDIAAMECYHSIAWDRERIADIILETTGIEVWSVHAPYGRHANISSPEPEAREGAVKGFCDAILAAAKLGAKVVVSHPGANEKYDATRREQFDASIEPFRRAADFAGERGVKLAIEPLPKEEIGNSLDEVIEMVETIDRPNVGINFDVNHLFPPEAIPDLIRKAGSRIFSIHVSDQDGVERHWLPFQGTLDWAEILKALVSTGYKGPLIYETHIHDVSSCDEVVKPIVENYRRLIQLAP